MTRSLAFQVRLIPGPEHTFTDASEASIYTQDISRALRVSALLKTGTVGVNKNFSPEVETPFGGVKASGSGRESGKAGLMEYLEPKTIHIRFVLSII